MKNKREIYQALLDGKKLKHKNFDPGNFLIMNDNGDLENPKGELSNYLWKNLNADQCEFWSIYEEPRVVLTPEDVGNALKDTFNNVSVIHGFIDGVYLSHLPGNASHVRRNGAWMELSK